MKTSRVGYARALAAAVAVAAVTGWAPGRVSGQPSPVAVASPPEASPESVRTFLNQ